MAVGTILPSGRAVRTRLSDSPRLERLSILVMCPPEIDAVSQCCTADPFFGAEIEPDGENERQLVGDLQAGMQLSRSLSGVAGVAADGNGAWREFYARYNPWIRRAVRAYRVRRCDRDDCVQEVWTAIVRKLELFDTHRVPCRFHRWLSTLIQRQIASFLRRRLGYHGEGIDPLESHADRADLSPATLYERQMTRRLVREVFADLREKLPALTFAVLDLRRIKEESVPDVAARLGVTCEQVWYREYRAMKRLRQLLEMRGLDDLGFARE